jgi:hypothetical protein
MQQEQGQQQGLGQAPPARGSTSSRRYRSLFWAIVLIGVGVVLLLFNLDVISPASLGMLTYVWPILIIGAGVDLLIGRKSLLFGSLVGVATVGVIIVLILVGPPLGWTGDTELKTETFTTPVDQASAVEVSLDTGGYSAKVHSLSSSTAPDSPLVSATVRYRGSVEFESTGDLEKTVSLDTKGQHWWWQFLDLADADAWEIGLAPDVPLDLTVESASGSVDLDLSGLQLTGVKAEMSSGDLQVLLPALGGQVYAAALEISSGDMEMEAAAGARIDMSVDMSSGDVEVALGEESDVTVVFNGSSGEFTLDLVSGQALRIEVRSVSSGDVNRPAGMVQVAQGDDEEGTWETQNYGAALHKVHLTIEHMSSGSVTVSQGS